MTRIAIPNLAITATVVQACRRLRVDRRGNPCSNMRASNYSNIRSTSDGTTLIEPVARGVAVKQNPIGYTLWPASFDLVDPASFLDEAEGLGVDTVEVPLFACRLIANGAILEPMIRIFE